MINAATTLNGLESNQPSGREPGSIKHLFIKVRELPSIDNLDFGDRLRLADIIHEAWYCGFNDRKP